MLYACHLPLVPLAWLVHSCSDLQHTVVGGCCLLTVVQ